MLDSKGKFMNIVVAGGSGFIGRELIKRLLEEQHTLTLLTRHPDKVAINNASLHVQRWDAQTVDGWADRVDGADAIINLTGETIAGHRWTTSQKQIILASRIDSTRALVLAIERATKKPAVFINASAVGFYGHVPAGDVPESFPKGDNFLANVCDQWEREARAAEKFGVRVVLARFGVILSRKGGALKKLMMPFSLFVGGHLGNGRQWFPWIHLGDVVAGIVFILTHRNISGAVNFSAPDAVTMREFCKALGRALGRPSWAPVPGFVLRLVLGEMANMLLTGQRVVPKKLVDSGYVFRFSSLGEALQEIARDSDS